MPIFHNSLIIKYLLTWFYFFFKWTPFRNFKLISHFQNRLSDTLKPCLFMLLLLYLIDLVLFMYVTVNI